MPEVLTSYRLTSSYLPLLPARGKLFFVFSDAVGGVGSRDRLSSGPGEASHGAVLSASADARLQARTGTSHTNLNPNPKPKPSAKLSGAQDCALVYLTSPQLTSPHLA
jgi:hypothetical protein